MFDPDGPFDLKGGILFQDGFYGHFDGLKIGWDDQFISLEAGFRAA